MCTGGAQIKRAAQLAQQKLLNVDIVEQMVCPGGCTNGGGVLRGKHAVKRAEGIAAAGDIEDIGRDYKARKDWLEGVIQLNGHEVFRTKQKE